MTSTHTNGVSVSYTYDNLNRLSTVVDARLSGSQTTTYGYDTANNIASVTYPNTVQFAFNYDALNRLTQIATGQTGYLYTFDAAGNRKTVSELSNRAVSWTYDGINRGPRGQVLVRGVVNRLTNETISLDPNNKNGLATYGLDPVGNRTSDTSTIAGLSPVSGTFNQGDELASESYDQDGNVTATGGKTFSYDTENHLVSMNGGAVQIIYDGDGNRVKKIVGGVTTQYLVDDLNPTGYPQVVEELTNGAVSRTYTYGLQRISEDQVVNSAWTPSFYGYDGLGTVRQLTGSTGAITDTYDYDAFGNKINSTGTTPNNYLYRGEQFDSDLGLYYLRARYYNPLIGRFMSRDPEDPAITNPSTLHRYLYSSADPVNRFDPTGLDDEEEDNGVTARVIARVTRTASALYQGAQQFYATAELYAGQTYLTLKDFLEIVAANEYVGAAARTTTCIITEELLVSFLNEANLTEDDKRVALIYAKAACSIWLFAPWGSGTGGGGPYFPLDDDF